MAENITITNPVTRIRRPGVPNVHFVTSRGPAGPVSTYPIEEVVTEVLTELEPEMDLTVRFNLILAGGTVV